MNKPNYKAPQIEIIEIETEGVILATSGTTNISDVKDGGVAF